MRNYLFLKNITINKSIHNAIYSMDRSNSTKTRKTTPNHCTFSTTMLDRSSFLFRIQTFTFRLTYLQIAIRTVHIVLWFITPQYSFPKFQFLNGIISAVKRILFGVMNNLSVCEATCFAWSSALMFHF